MLSVGRRVQTVLFPNRWSRMLAWIVLASLSVTIVSGVYLALYFNPSMSEVTYHGPVDYLRGLVTTRAYASGLDISFGVRGGLFVRQLHSWAASLFIASLLASLATAFFTGLFRTPRRRAWAVGALLLPLGVFEAYTGVLLLDDGQSGTSLRMVSGYTLTVPVLGTRLSEMLFGSEFPGTHIVGRLYLIHLVLPGIMLGLVALVAVPLLRHRRPGSPGDSGSCHTSRRRRFRAAMPAIAVSTLTAGVLAILAGLAQVNPIWLYGPANTANAAGTSTPPWYFGWVDGAVRLWPAWDIHVGGYTIPAPFWPSVVLLGTSFAALVLYPWIERRITRDDAPRARPQRPREAPGRTALGVGVVVLYGCLQLAGGTDVISSAFHLSADEVYWTLRFAVLILPPLSATVTYRICRWLQQRDRAILETGAETGAETGIIHRLPSGGYREAHRPLTALDDRDRLRELEHAGVPRTPPPPGQ
jgi:ubiquinol-cytochrome c reductase cytochrome b subunit